MKRYDRWSAKTFFLAVCVLLAVNQAKARSVQCVVQAFGTGLNDKGISVTVKQSGFGCNGVFPWDDVTKSAKFDSTGEAEVKLNLYATEFGICMTQMEIEVTFDYKGCSPVKRTVLSADWGFIAKHGSCRALEQQCGRGARSVAAVPYIDMWCRWPTSHVFNSGQPEEMRLGWRQKLSIDKC